MGSIVVRKRTAVVGLDNMVEWLSRISVDAGKKIYLAAFRLRVPVCSDFVAVASEFRTLTKGQRFPEICSISVLTMGVYTVTLLPFIVTGICSC